MIRFQAAGTFVWTKQPTLQKPGTGEILQFFSNTPQEVCHVSVKPWTELIRSIAYRHNNRHTRQPSVQYWDHIEKYFKNLANTEKFFFMLTAEDNIASAVAKLIYDHMP